MPLLKYACENDAPLYRGIVAVFVANVETYRSRLRPADVLAALPTVGGFVGDVALEDLPYRLDKLVEWGNLHRERDDALTNSLAELESRGFVYDLTPAGESTHGALEMLEEGLDKAGGLQTAVLRHILDLLTGIVDAVAEGARDPEGLYAGLDDLHGNFRTLTGNATLFMQGVSRVLNTATLDPGRFQTFKADTVSYLTTFVADLGALTAAITSQLVRLAAVPAGDRAAAYAAAGRAGGQRLLDAPDRDLVAEYVEQAQRRIDGFAGWFLGAGDEPPRARLLSDAATNAVLGILRAAERLRDALAHPTSQAEDFTLLARLFSGAPSDAAAHDLWRAAFALSSSRHLAYSHDDADAVPARVSWWEAAAVTLPISLRESGRADSVRRATAIPDHRAAQRSAAAAERARLRAADAEIAALVALGRTTLAALPLLPDAAFDFLYEMCDVALRTAPRDGRHSAVSRDGQYRIQLSPAHGEAVIRVANRGRLTRPNYSIEIVATRAPVSRSESHEPAAAGMAAP